MCDGTVTVALQRHGRYENYKYYYLEVLATPAEYENDLILIAYFISRLLGNMTMENRTASDKWQTFDSGLPGLYRTARSALSLPRSRAGGEEGPAGGVLGFWVS